MARKRLTKNQRIIQQQKRRIQSAIRRLQKQGYEVDFKMADVEGRITKKTIEKFRSISPSYLRAISSHVSPIPYQSEYKKKRSALDREIEERQKQLNEMRDFISTLSEDSSFYSSSVRTADLMQKELDLLQQRRLEQDTAYAEKFNQRNMVYGELTSRISALSGENFFIEGYLKNMLQSEISEYGEEAVLKSIANIPEEEIEKTDRVLKYATKTEQKSKQLLKLVGIIKGTMLTSEEMRTVTSLMEATNFDEDDVEE